MGVLSSSFSGCMFASSPFLAASLFLPILSSWGALFFPDLCLVAPARDFGGYPVKTRSLSCKIRWVVQGWVPGKMREVCTCAMVHTAVVMVVLVRQVVDWMSEVWRVLYPPLYFFSTLTFWLSHERPSKMPVGVCVSVCNFSCSR